MIEIIQTTKIESKKVKLEKRIEDIIAQNIIDASAAKKIIIQIKSDPIISSLLK